MTGDHEALDRLLSESFDERLSAEQAAELERLIRSSRPDAWVPLLEMELTLRASLAAPSAVDGVLRALRSRAATSIGKPAPPVRMSPGRRRSRWLAGCVLGAAACALAAPVIWRRLHPVPASSDVARVGAVSPASDRPLANRTPIFIPPPAPEFAPGPSVPPASVGPSEDTVVDDARASVPQGSVIWWFDFETAGVPTGFTSGEIVTPVNPREGSRYALLGTFGRYAPNVRSIVFQPEGGVVVYDDSLILRFRYFLEDGARRVRLQMYNRDQRQNYQFTVPDPVANQWTSVEVPLRAFYPVRDQSKRQEPGGWITNLYFMGGSLPGAAFLVDDIELSR